jgi:hypothetical protein
MALRDTVSGTANVPLGCCASIIGLDIGTVHKTQAGTTQHHGGSAYAPGASPLKGLALDAGVTLPRMGTASATFGGALAPVTQAVEHTDGGALPAGWTPGAATGNTPTGAVTKAVRLEAAVGAVAIAGVVANLYVNGTGKALVAQDVVLAKAP